MTTSDPTTAPTTTEEHDMHDEHTTPATATTNDNGTPADEHTTPGIDTAPPANDAGQPANDAGQPADDTAQPADEHSGDPRVKAARAEAAKYRTRLRETENQLAETNQRYEKLLRQIISATAAQHHRIPAAALWDSGLNPADVLNEGGEIDLDKLTEACTSARKRYGIPAPINGPYVPGVGTQPQAPLDPKWDDVLKDLYG